jgi:hypothetical protein
MRPIVDGLEQGYDDRVDFRRYNIASEDGEAWASQYSLRGHPAFLLLDSRGQESWRYLGVIPREAIETELKAVLP